jgi:GT2 family glycosyltransferase
MSTDAEPPATTPSVGIVIVNYNGAAFIGEFAQSVLGIAYPNFRLIAIDNASTDGSPDELARRCPDAVILRCQENKGFAGGNNVGIDYCLERRFDYVLFLNNDTVVTEGFLATLVDAADGRTMVVPKILYYFDHSLISTHAGDFDWSLGRFRHTHHAQRDGPAANRPRDLQTASFCCLLAPSQVLRDVGPLDERFFMYYEETDFLRRALDRGYRLRYIPQAVVYHRESASSGGGWMTPFKHYYATRNRLYLVKRHSPSRLRFALFTLYFWATRLPYVLRYLLSRDWKMLRAMLLGMLHYYRGRMGRTLQVQDF